MCINIVQFLTVCFKYLFFPSAEAYIASMSAAASHHPIYALPPSALPQLVEPPLPLPLPSSSAASSSTSSSPAHSNNQAPLSLVKQEPRDLSCAEKVAKQSERRAMGVKVDLDQHHARLPTSQGLSPAASGGGVGNSGSGGATIASSSVWSAPLKEPKLSPSTPAVSPETSAASKHERRHAGGGGGGGGRGQGGRATPSVSVHNSSNTDSSNSIGNGQNSNKPASSSVGSSDGASQAFSHREETSRHNGHNLSSRRSVTPGSGSTTSPGRGSINSSNGGGAGGAGSQNNSVSNGNSSTASRKSGKSSGKQQKSLGARDMSIPSVPTKLAPPIPLATVQHDGVVLSALASPSSAAASSAASKNFAAKQAATIGLADEGNSSGVVSAGGGDQRGGSSPAASSRQADAGLGSSSSYPLTVPAHSSNAKDRASASANSRSASTSRNSSQERSEVKISSDENSDIVVDSTENDDVMSTCDVPAPPPPQPQPRATAAAAIKSEQERAIEETIERVLAHEDSRSDTVDTVDNLDTVSAEPAVGVSRAVTSGVTPSTGSASSTRTVYAKTQSVPSITASGESSIRTKCSILPPQTYHNLSLRDVEIGMSIQLQNLLHFYHCHLPMSDSKNNSRHSILIKVIKMIGDGKVES